MKIRKLGPQDAEVWRKIRLEGLKAFPQAFLTQDADVEAKPLEALADQLRTNSTFVAFEDDEPIASMGYVLDRRLAVQHRATIVAVYVREAWQGKGVAEKLLEAVIADMPAQVLQIHLDVAATNPRAITFYERHGFVKVGTLPRATFVNSTATDDHIMVRMLD